MALLRLHKRLINDCVWSFCYQCRNPQRIYAYQWWFPSSLWAEHLSSIENSNYGRTEYSQYHPFNLYGQANYKGPYTYYMALLRSLELYTATWTDEHFQYAHELMSKYYGVTCDGNT